MLIKSRYGCNVWSCSSLDVFKRGLKFLFQRIKNGWDDTECWNLDLSISRFVLPRLKRLKQIAHGYPSELNNADEWDKILDKMIDAFEILSRGSFIYNEGNEKIIDEGLSLFCTYYHSLWD